MFRLAKRKGVTLIEVVIVLAIFAMIIQVIYSVFFIGNKSYAISKDIGFEQQELRNTSIALRNRIKMAKGISISNLSENEIVIEDFVDDGLNLSNIIIDGIKFGPFIETSFTVNMANEELSLPLYSPKFSSVGDLVTVRFENWNSFINITELIDPLTNNSIEFKTLYYATH